MAVYGSIENYKHTFVFSDYEEALNMMRWFSVPKSSTVGPHIYIENPVYNKPVIGYIPSNASTNVVESNKLQSANKL